MSNQSYCNKRLASLGITPEENATGENRYTFEDDGNGNIEIRYVTADGSRMTFKKKDSRYKPGYSRTRYKTPFPDKKTGKLIKYHTPSGATIRPFLNGIVKFFPDGDIETLYLTEGEFKAFMGCKYGIPTIGLSGIHSYGHAIKNEEGFTIDVKLLPELKKLIAERRVKNLVLLHDADATENQDKPDRLASFYSSVTHFKKACKSLPVKIYYAHIQKEFISTGKGLDDLLVSKSEFSESIKKEIFTKNGEKYFKFFDLQKTGLEEVKHYFIAQSELSKPDLHITVNQYVSEKAIELITHLTTHKRIILKARTGSGKTTFVLDHLPTHFTGRIIILQPLTVIVDAIAKQKYGVIGVIKEGSTPEDIQTALNSKIVVCTYDSFSKIDNYTENDLIIGDEIHYLISAYNMPDKRAKYEYAFKRLCEAKNVLLISATPQATLRKYGFKWVEVEPEQSSQVEIHRIEYKGRIHHYLPGFINGFKPAAGKIIVRLNAGEKSEEIIKCLNGYNCTHLSAEGKEDPAGVYKHIVEHKALPDDLHVLISTSVIDCGVDINNTDIQAVIIAEDAFNVNEADTLQFIARFRKVKKLPVYIFKKVREVEYRATGLFDELSDFAQSEVKALNEVHKLYVNSAYIAKAPDYSETSKYSLFNKTTNCYEVNQMALLYEVNRVQTHYTPANLYFERLSNEKYVKIVSSTMVDFSDNQHMIEFDKGAKVKKEEARKVLLKLLETDTQYVFIAAYFRIKDLTLRKQIAAAGFNLGSQICDDAALLYESHKSVFDSQVAKTIFTNYLKLKQKGVDTSDICRILTEYNGRRLGDLLTHVALLYKLEANPETLSPADQRDSERIRQHKQELLTHQEPRTAKGITTIINQHRPKGIRLTVNKAVQLYRMLFNHHSYTAKVGNHTVRFYVIDNQISYNELLVTGLTIINKEIPNSVTYPEPLHEWNKQTNKPCPF